MPKVYIYKNGKRALLNEEGLKHLNSIYWIIINQLNCSELHIIDDWGNYKKN